MSTGREWQKGKWVFGDTPVSVPLGTPQSLRRPARHWIRACETKSLQVTAEVLGGKHFRMPQSLTQSSHGPARDGTRGFAVKGRRLAAWVTARSSGLQKYESRSTFLSGTSRYPKQNCLVWSFPRLHPTCTSDDNSITNETISTEHWRNDLAGETRGSTLWQETRQCQFVHQKPYTEWTGIELGPSRW